VRNKANFPRADNGHSPRCEAVEDRLCETKPISRERGTAWEIVSNKAKLGGGGVSGLGAGHCGPSGTTPPQDGVMHGCSGATKYRGAPSICHVERSAAQSRHLASQTAHLSISARPLDCARGDRKGLFRHKMGSCTG
jgi:hypothetical protein